MSGNDRTAKDLPDTAPLWRSANDALGGTCFMLMSKKNCRGKPSSTRTSCATVIAQTTAFEP
jgi:hypothetical protein